jgi:hypothetical protein
MGGFPKGGFPKGGFPKGGFPKGGFPPFGVFEVPAVLNLTHKSNITISNPSQVDWALLGQNRSVILSPESVDGPFCKLEDFYLCKKDTNSYRCSRRAHTQGCKGW